MGNTADTGDTTGNKHSLAESMDVVLKRLVGHSRLFGVGYGPAQLLVRHNLIGHFLDTRTLKTLYQSYTFSSHLHHFRPSHKHVGCILKSFSGVKVH